MPISPFYRYIIFWKSKAKPLWKHAHSGFGIVTVEKETKDEQTVRLGNESEWDPIYPADIVQDFSAEN